MKEIKEVIESLGASESLTEALAIGYQSIFEGYADIDVRNHHDMKFDSFAKAQNMAAQNSPAMALLMKSQQGLAKHYTSDEEPELDGNATSLASLLFDQFDAAEPTGDHMIDSLGISAIDLAPRAPMRKTTSDRRVSVSSKKKYDNLDLSDLGDAF